MLLFIGFFNHGYEFMGSNKNIVITPLTNRIFLTFTQALMMNLGGATHGMNNLFQFNINNLQNKFKHVRFTNHKILLVDQLKSIHNHP